MKTTTATIKDGMLTINAEKSIIEFIKIHIMNLFAAFSEAEEIEPANLIKKLEQDKDYLEYFIEHIELSYAYIGLHELLYSI